MANTIAKGHELRREVGCEEEVEVYGVLDEATGLKGHINGTIEAAKNRRLNLAQGTLICRGAEIIFQERPKGWRKTFLYSRWVRGNTCEDRNCREGGMPILQERERHAQKRTEKESKEAFA